MKNVVSKNVFFKNQRNDEISGWTGFSESIAGCGTLFLFHHSDLHLTRLWKIKLSVSMEKCWRKRIEKLFDWLIKSKTSFLYQTCWMFRLYLHQCIFLKSFHWTDMKSVNNKMIDFEAFFCLFWVFWDNSIHGKLY